jgi:hypothetical protein
MRGLLFPGALLLIPCAAAMHVAARRRLEVLAGNSGGG